MRAGYFCAITRPDFRAGCKKKSSPLMSLAAVFLGAMILLMLIPCLLLLPLFVGVLCSCFMVRYLVSF